MALAVRRYRVEGEVQGVGFRWYVREQARALELAGWVRNEPDGTVVLVAAGEAEAMDALERQLRVGPRHSAVTDVSRRELTSFDAVDLPALFTIER
jgi:acylphosphatase